MNEQREVSFGFFTSILLILMLIHTCSMSKDVDRIADALERQNETVKPQTSVSDVQPTSEKAGVQAKDF